MANDKDKKPKANKELDDALKEFEDAGGFDDSSSNVNNQRNEDHEDTDNHINDFDDFSDFDLDIPDDTPRQKPSNKNERNRYDDISNDDEEIEIDDDFDEDKSTNQAQSSFRDKFNAKIKNNKSAGGGKDRLEFVKTKLKEPKNLVILIIAICFTGFLIFQSGSKKKRIEYQNPQAVQEEVLSDISDIKKTEPMPDNAKIQYDDLPTPKLKDIELPNLDIELPKINKSDVELLPDIPQPKIPEPKKEEDKKNDTEKKEIIIPEPDKKDEEIPSLDDKLIKKNRKPITEKTQLKPLIQDFADGVTIPKKTMDAKNSRDFIFIDTDLDTEIEESKITAKRIENPENVIAQGRIIDAVLETAIDSTIGGQVRAIATRDVYAEVGKNILIPKGTRLYGQYGGSGDASKNARIVITWTRIMRPDNISATINSFASDQFGRSGIEGEVDQKYFSNITSSLLLSAIPLVTTIITNAITNQQPQTVNVGAQGNTTVIQDPVNIATQAFANNVSRTTADIIKNLVDTSPTIVLNQGTRIKILVNQDIKLPEYKAITRMQSGVSVKSGK